MRHVTAEEIAGLAPMKDVIEAVKEAFALTEKGLIETPLRTRIDAAEGSLLFMPAYSPALKLACLKNVNVFPGNAGLGLPTTPAEILLIDAGTGLIRAMLDGTSVTRLRTGAASGAAFEVLARKDCVKGALIGTGGQAEAQLEAMLTARPLKQVSVFSRGREKLEAFCARMREKYAAAGVRVLAAASADECVRDADLIITATTSPVPVFDGTLVKKGATVSCVGTYEPEKHEIDPALITRADKIYCDSTGAVLSECGDVLIPLRQGLLKAEAIRGGLGEVINGTLPGRESEEEIIVFESVGIGAQDLTTCAMIWKKLSGAAGTEAQPPRAEKR